MKTKKNEMLVSKKGTLDQKHTERINKFEKMNRSLPSKKDKLRKLELELEDLQNTNPNKYSHEDIRRKAHLMDTIQNLKEEINSIENCTESLNYIVNTLPILVDYYDNDGLVDDGFGEEMVNDVNDSGKKNIISYFMQESTRNVNKKNAVDNNDLPLNEQTGLKKTPRTKSSKRTVPEKNKKNPSGSKTSKPNKKTVAPDKTDNGDKQLSRAVLFDNYLNVTDINHRRNRRKISNICPREGCGGEKILSQNDSYLVCKKCGLSEVILLPTDKPNYKEPTQDSGTYAYKRINHLTEILSQLQAKESTDIPHKVFESVLRELRRRGVDKNDLDIFRLRKILKKLNYRKYYEHVPHILQIINGKEPPNFSRRDEMKIKQMFKQIQKPFAIYCPKNRKNFLNYSYVLHKFCELLELDDYISYFPLLKNNAKLLQHDKIWKSICAYQRWAFYKSL